MDINKLWYYEKLATKVLESLSRNNIEGLYLKTGKEAK